MNRPPQADHVNLLTFQALLTGQPIILRRLGNAANSVANALRGDGAKFVEEVKRLTSGDSPVSPLVEAFGEELAKQACAIACVFEQSLKLLETIENHFRDGSAAAPGVEEALRTASGAASDGGTGQPQWGFPNDEEEDELDPFDVGAVGIPSLGAVLAANAAASLSPDSPLTTAAPPAEALGRGDSGTAAGESVSTSGPSDETKPEPPKPAAGGQSSSASPSKQAKSSKAKK